MPDSVSLRTATPADVHALASLAARCQPLPDRHCTYASASASAIAAELVDIDRWAERTTVAVRGDRTLGWILADVDLELGRVWWWGPFLDPDTVPLPEGSRGGADGSDGNGTSDDDTGDGGDGDAPRGLADDLADALLTCGRDLFAAKLAAKLGEEIAIDERSYVLARFARRNGFTAEEASACLELRPHDFVTDAPVVPAIRVEPLTDATADAVAALHDRAFAGTHTTGRALVDPDPRTEHRWVAIDATRSETGNGPAVVGYVATERHHDGSWYVDFLAVDPAHRGRGIGRALVHHATRAGLDAGATHAHLTVRVGNAPARALYTSLGYRIDRIVVPYRRGFSLGN